MKLTIDRDELFGALQKVQSVVEKKNTVQILGNILCTAQSNRLSLCATDLEVGIKVTVEAQVAKEGRITLSARHFLDIIKELPSRPVQISTKDNNWVEIVSDKARFNIVSLSADEYPALPAFEDKQYFDARAGALTEMVNKTEFAVSTDATRYHLNGVYLEKLDNNMLRMTATDGHRLSIIDHEVFLQMPEFKRGIIIPKKGLAELKKLLEYGEETVRLAFDRGYFFAQYDQIYLFVRLIEGEYPDVKQVIPKSTEHTAIIDREAFISALRRVSLLAHEKSKSIKFNIKPNFLEITSSNPDMGEAREEMEIEYISAPVEISFNAKYLLDCLPVISSQKLEFKFKDRLSPGIFQGADQKNHTYIVMPMRI